MDVPTVPLRQPHALAVPPGLHELREAGPIQRVRTAVGHEGWLVTGYDEVRELLHDDRIGRSHEHPEDAARTAESAIFGGPMGDFGTEKADHVRMRSLMQPHFSPKRMRAFQPRVEALTDELLDALEVQGPPGDLHQALALPLPILVICELLGVPYEDRAQFRVWSEQVGNTRDRATSEKGLGDLFNYGLELVAKKRLEPGDDVISRLAATDGVPDLEAAAMGMMLLFAGHETTVSAIGQGALLLMTNPDQREILLEDPSRIDAAVDEILRAPSAIANGIPRYAREDFEFRDVKIAKGDLLMLDTASADHDPQIYPDPGRFDVSREAATVLRFGHGARYCIGAPLARIELRTVFSRLIPRFPGLRLAVPIEEVPMRTDMLTGGVTEIPVAW